MRGYLTSFGYMGYMPDKGTYVLFATEAEYMDAFYSI